MHNKETAVEHGLKGGTHEHREMFKMLKRSGIIKHNMNIAGQKGAVLLRERKTQNSGSTVICDCCCGVFKRRWFGTHRRRCGTEQCVQPRAIASTIYFSSMPVSKDFKKDILSKFSGDEIGELCQKNESIAMIGSKIYMKVRARVDKKLEVRRSVMADMRRLAHMFCCFRTIANSKCSSRFSENVDVSVLEMFKRENFDILELAFANYTEMKDGEHCTEKSGLALAVYYLLVKAAKIVKVFVFHLKGNDDARAAQTGDFLDVLHSCKHELIGGAIYNTNKKRQTKLRRVESLPLLSEVQKLKTYICSSMSALIEGNYLHWTSKEFVDLHDLACARLTLFNARREGEPARLHLTDWVDGCNGVWLDKQRIEKMSAEEREIFEESFVMYQTGKGMNHLVPVQVPQDTMPALQKVTDTATRIQCGISEANVYLFSSTLASEANVSGWHALNRVCQKAGVESHKITATKMRHLASTTFEGLELPEEKRKAFYSHMGHSRAINESIYQAPLAEREILEVGAVLR